MYIRISYLYMPIHGDIMWYKHLKPRSESGAAARVQSAPCREMFALKTTVISTRWRKQSQGLSHSLVSKFVWKLVIEVTPFLWPFSRAMIHQVLMNPIFSAFHLHETIAAIASSKVAQHPVASHLSQHGHGLGYMPRVSPSNCRCAPLHDLQ